MAKNNGIPYQTLDAPGPKVCEQCGRVIREGEPTANMTEAKTKRKVYYHAACFMRPGR